MKKLLNLFSSRLGQAALFGLILLLPSQALAGKNVFKFFEDTEIHGFVSTSYSYNTNKPASATNCGVTGTCLRIFDQDDNSFKLDIAELVFLKETPDVGDIGFRIDLAYGFSLPEVSQQGGSSPSIPKLTTNAAGDNDFDLQQAYVSWKAPVGNGLQLDMGKFITHIGLEVIEGYDGWNWYFSRIYLFGLAIPFVHTGIRASYDINDQLSAMVALVNGFSTTGTTDSNNAKSLGLQLGYAPTDNIGILVNWLGG
ncbi:MAG: outer membrane beta-barrel protein, partial [Nitrospinaceae bacterium]